MVGQHYFTWCPKGTGLAETPGFQTRAKSPSISQEVERSILRYCSRYELPRSLDALKTKVEDLTAEELARTPVSLHFYPISQGLRSLTRIRLHPKQSGRGGNFFAHTLVFPTDALAEVGYNPFEIVRSGIFKDSDEGASKQLPDLPQLPVLVRSAPLGARVCPSRTAVESLFRGLVVKPQERRPMILLPARMEDAAVLIESALLLLPEDVRAEIAFSTYEPDPYRLLDPSGIPLHILATISREEGGKFEFREDEYKATFFVVNVPENRTSEPIPACPEYLGLAGAALTEPGSRATDQFEERKRVIGDLRVGLAPEKWDALAPAASLGSSLEQLEPTEWKSAASVLAANCSDQASAKPALTLLTSKASPEMAREGLLLLGGAKKRAVHVPSYLYTAAFVLIAVVATYFLTKPTGLPTGVAEKHEVTSQAKPDLIQEPADSRRREAVGKLKQALTGKGVQVSESDGLVSVMFDAGLFGDTDSLLPEGRTQLSEVAKKIPRAQIAAIHVEGVTDSRPVKRGAGYDNYELGYRRAVAVVRELRAAGLPSGLFRLSSSGTDNPVNSVDPADPRNRTVILRFEPKL